MPYRESAFDGKASCRGGAGNASIANKPLMAEGMAAEYRLPIARIIEG